MRGSVKTSGLVVFLARRRLMISDGSTEMVSEHFAAGQTPAVTKHISVKVSLKRRQDLLLEFIYNFKGFFPAFIEHLLSSVKLFCLFHYLKCTLSYVYQH